MDLDSLRIKLAKGGVTFGPLRRLSGFVLGFTESVRTWKGRPAVVKKGKSIDED